LLAWNKDIYTERFLTLVPCTCVLKPTLVHCYWSSLLYPGPLPIVVSANLSLLFLLHSRDHTIHFKF
jgi:hypothetical protein